MTYETFTQAWNNLSDSEKIACYNEYASQYYPDEQLYIFDEEFFNMFFEGRPMEAVRATHFGNIKNWSDEYIRFNGYANLVSLSEWEAAEWADDYIDGLFEHEEIWGEYIDADAYENE